MNRPNTFGISSRAISIDSFLIWQAHDGRMGSIFSYLIDHYPFLELLLRKQLLYAAFTIDQVALAINCSDVQCSEKAATCRCYEGKWRH
ncbi:hypothetical protein HAX54_021638 [Datura stramonium]|uniref:Uncharacterized protein n=1 Tax=Datura stramonium TaxID=4076 RepID=A0ABS8RLW1_DATST|nr:hypothetical protein [Datura stramonium]